LSKDKRHQVVALGRLGWSLRRIEGATGVRRETAGDYLKAAGTPVRSRGGRPRVWPPNPATTPVVSTDSSAKPTIAGEVSTDSAQPKPAARAEVPLALHPGAALAAGTRLTGYVR